MEFRNCDSKQQRRVSVRHERTPCYHKHSVCPLKTEKCSHTGTYGSKWLTQRPDSRVSGRSALFLGSGAGGARGLWVSTTIQPRYCSSSNNRVKVMEKLCGSTESTRCSFASQNRTDFLWLSPSLQKNAVNRQGFPLLSGKCRRHAFKGMRDRTSLWQHPLSFHPPQLSW